MIGIDFSMASAAVVIGRSIYPEDLQMLCFRQRKKDSSLVDNITVIEYPDAESDEERYYKVAKPIVDFILKHSDNSQVVWIEDYSFNSTGNVFNIAEATATLKHMLWMEGFEINKVSPKSVKKFAGNGKADKNDMYDMFVEKTGYDFNKSFDGPTKDLRTGYTQVPSPVSDIIDAYYVLHYGHANTIGV